MTTIDPGQAKTPVEQAPAQRSMEDVVASSDLKIALDDFLTVYSQRPVERNLGGMRLNHSFATWFMLKVLQPRVVIESGVWMGHSTWLIEQACPNAKIFCLDLDFSHLSYRSQRATYIAKDFSQISWADIDPASAVCFFDDHQNAYQRAKDLRWAGFKRAIFEDNFPCGEGDCYSLRHMRTGFGHPHLQMSKKFLGDAEQQERNAIIENVLRYFGARQHALVEPNADDCALFARNCKTYFEFPPIALMKTSPIWDAPYEDIYQAPPAIYARDQLPSGLQAIMNRDPTEFDYVYIAFIELT